MDPFNCMAAVSTETKNKQVFIKSWTPHQGRIQDFEMGVKMLKEIKKSNTISIFGGQEKKKKRKERRGLGKKKRGRGGGENSPISSPLDPCLLMSFSGHKRNFVAVNLSHDVT